MHEYKLFAQRVGLVGITNLIVNLRGLILIPILTKTLGADAYGVWSVIMVTISLLSPLALLGLTTAMVRFLAAEKDKTKIQEGFYSVIFVVLFVSLILSLIVFLFADSFAITILKDVFAAPLIIIASVVILLQALDLASLEFFRAFGRMKKYSGLILLQTFAEVGFVAYFVLSGFGLFGAVVSLVISRGVVLLVCACFVLKEIGFRLPKFYGVGDYLKFGLPLVPTAMLGWITSSSDRYLIGFFSSSQMVGIYSAAYNIGAVIGFFGAPLQIIIFPAISKLYEEKKGQEIKAYLAYSLKYFLLFAIPSIFGLTILSKQILLIMTRPEFAAQGLLVLPIVAVGALFFGLYGAIFAWILIVAKRTRLIFVLVSFSAMINLILNIFFIPVYGILAAAITTLIAYFILFLLTSYFSQKYIKFVVPYAFIGKSVFASLVMALILYWTNPAGIFYVGLMILVGVGAYFGVLMLLKGFGKEEVTFLKDIFKV
jgi:O-antigen/teichoic acid export membrane protein